MNFLKNKGKIFLLGAFCLFLILQQFAIRYGRSYREQAEGIDRNGYDKLAIYEVNQLQRIWRRADVDNLLHPVTLESFSELENTRIRLKEAEEEIHNSEKRVKILTGKRREFFDKVHAYYNHSVTALVSIIDFLLSKKGEYTVNGNEITFVNETDGEKLRSLISKLNILNIEKAELDDYISAHNQAIQKSYLRVE